MRGAGRIAGRRCGEDMPVTVDDFERRLAVDIEAGQFDDAALRRDAAFAAIKAINAARLAITNPKLLTTK
jgi:hypothetical protein